MCLTDSAVFPPAASFALVKLVVKIFRECYPATYSNKKFSVVFLKKNLLSVHTTKNLDEVLCPKHCPARLRTKYFIFKECV